VPPDPQSFENDLRELRDQLQSLTERLRDEIDSRKFLQTRVSQQEGQIRELERRTLAILQSRIWQTLCAIGGRLLRARERIDFWRTRVRLAVSHMVQLATFTREAAIIHVDSPSSTSEISGRVKIKGWAIAASGVDGVEVRLGNRLIIRAKTGLVRADVAKRYPEYLESDRSGFSVIADVSDFRDGDYPLMIYARSRRGFLDGHRISVKIRRANALRKWSPEAVLETLKGMQRKPTISVLMPTFEAPEPWLRRAIESVLAQYYPNWELCIADDASQTARVKEILEEYRKRDPRIKVTYRESNGHIAAASNSALDMATGEFIALLDHDDEITPDALLEIACAYNGHSDADMFYSDEDKIDEENFCSDPFYKPDWSPEYFMTCMYTCHLGVYRTSLVRELGAFRSEMNGAQDYDLALRFATHTTRVIHVPRVLYHWRTHSHSTARSGEVKDYAYPAAQRALRDHLRRLSFDGEVLPGPRYGFHRIRFAIRGEPRVSVIIPSAARVVNKNGRPIDLLRECVESILDKSTWRNLEIIVVDNGDLRQDLKTWLEPRVRMVTYTDTQFNLARKINEGARHATGEHLLLLNDDITVIAADWVENMLQYSQQPEIGAVGAKLLFPDGRIQHAGVILLDAGPGHAYYNHPNEEIGYFLSAVVARNYLAVTGACLMTRLAVFWEAGGFSEDFPLNYNDVDFCLKLHTRGYRIVYVPEATLYHHESLSKEGPGSLRPGELERFKAKWTKHYSVDPYYNPNLPSDYLYYEVE
jgi:GT2 family glycosyltransferase